MIAPGNSSLTADPESAESRKQNRFALSGGALQQADPLPQLASQLHDAQQTARDLAALIELVERLQSATDIKRGCHRLVDELRLHLQADHVAVGICDPAGSRDDRLSAPVQSPSSVVCRVQAISGQPSIDPTSEICRLSEAVLQESVARSAASAWPPGGTGNRHALLAHRQFVDHHRLAAVVGTPLRDGENRCVGAVFAAFGNREQSACVQDSVANSPAERPDDVSRASRFLAAAEPMLATTLSLMMRSNESPLRVAANGLRTAFCNGRLRTASVIAGIVLTILLLPMQYNVQCESELQPAERRYVAAPFDGPLEECFVQPGDYVESDQLLARMDGREIHWELAGLKADLGRATNERNSKLADHEFGDAEIARHEVRRLQNRSELLVHRDNNLEVRSPVSGIVISGDHKDAEGVPLETGQSLFEIAPLDRMIIEVAVPEDDVRWVREGQPVSLFLNAMPSADIAATICRIHPRAELRDNENVFVAEAEIDNSQLQLKPGMRGRAKIAAGRYPLGWNLFHKPVAHLAGWLGW
ncbi:MAG: efflux RND transporter periplasmic adaptor subunit [Planctomycetaceae bacterium]